MQSCLLFHWHMIALCGVRNGLPMLTTERVELLAWQTKELSQRSHSRSHCEQMGRQRVSCSQLCHQAT